MNSPYKKSGMSNQKAAFLKKALKTGIIDLPHVSKRPFFKLVTQESFEGYTWCSCKSPEEHESKRIEYEKDHPPQPENIETIHSRTGYEGSKEDLRKVLNEVFHKKSKTRGTKRGRPPKAVNEKYLITQEDKKGLAKEHPNLCDYMRIKEKDLIKFLEENKDLTNEFLESAILSSLPSSLKEGITEIQLRRRCRMMIEKRVWLN